MLFTMNTNLKWKLNITSNSYIIVCIQYPGLIMKEKQHKRFRWFVQGCCRFPVIK